jgi:hypothetical protein
MTEVIFPCKKAGLIFAALLLLTGLAYAPMLDEVGSVDRTSIKRMKGKWLVRGSNYLFDFSDKPVRKIFGLQYYRYRTLPESKYRQFIYTIVKAKKNGTLYFARGKYHQGQFVGTVSKMAFSGKNRLIVYEKNNSRQVYFTATRYFNRHKKG